MPYSLNDLRRAQQPKSADDDLLARILPDAPHSTDDVLGCWNGERFVSWREWLFSQPVEAFIDEKRDTNSTPEPARPIATRSAQKPKCPNYDESMQHCLDICVQMH